MQKRLLITVLALAMSFSMLAGCGKAAEDDSSDSGNNSVAQIDDNSEGAEDDAESEEDDTKAKEDDMESTEDDIDSADDSAEEDLGADDASVPPQNDSDVTEDNTAPTNGNAASAGSNNSAVNGADTNGTAASKEDYLNDLQEFVNMFGAMDTVSEDPDQIMTDMQKVINNLNVKTPEGLALKADLQDMTNVLGDALANQDNFDEAAFDAAMERLVEIQENSEKHSQEFALAAAMAGVDEKDLANFGDMF